LRHSLRFDNALHISAFCGKTEMLSGSHAVTGNKGSLCIRRMTALLVLFFVSFAGTIVALDPKSHISQYGHTVWRVQDGYFGGQPASITQTTDGYLWVGTATGVYRFDGVQFVPWTTVSGEKLPSNDVDAVFGARDGSLWIATENGLLQWVNQRAARYLDGRELNSILQDDKGAIWVTKSDSSASRHPICRINGTDVQCYGYETGAGGPLAAAIPLAEDAAGNLWIGHDTAVVRWGPGSTKVYRPAALQSHQGVGGVEGLAVAADGSVWVGMDAPGHGGGLQHIVNGVMEPFAVPKLNGESLEVEALLIDRQDNVWVGTENQGIYRIHRNDVDHFGSADGLSSDYVQRIFEDREGDLWIATSNGIDMLRDLRVTTISKREGLSEDAVESVLAARDGTVWIGSDHLQAVVNGSVSPVLGKGLPGNFVTCLLEDHTGRLWAGMDNTLWIHEGGTKSGTFRQIMRKDGSPIGMVRGLAEDSEHNIWVQTNGPPARLTRIQDLKIQEEFPVPPTPRAWSLATDPQSGIWLGLVFGNLARLRSGKTEIFEFSSHPKTPVHALFAAPDGSILGATEFGIVGWKSGKQQILTVRNDLPCDWINELNSDDQGDLWLYSACGLIEIPRDEVQRWWKEPEGKLKTRIFDALDGVRAGVSAFSGSSRGPDGRLWFANNSVAQTFDPAHMTGNTLPPPVHINGIVADRKAYPPQQALKLPALTRDLEIDYTALSFVAPKKVLFRYMLEGHDGSWQEPGTRRQAFYNDLRPGKYRFRVIACNNDGVWNETGASLDFSILPAYYQTVWFRSLCAGVILLLAWFLHRLRVQQLQHQFNIGLEAKVSERTRIARELHDTLLQSFHGLLLGFQAASNLLPARPDDAKKRLDASIAQGSHAIAEGRDAVQDLRSPTQATNDLAAALRILGDELVAGDTDTESPVIDVAVEGQPRSLRPIVRDEVFRISAEALRNAFRHAQAKRIETEIRYGADEFRVRVRDDGKGMDVEAVGGGAGHFGLSGIRERAKVISANLEVWSSLGSGTELQLTVPSSAAYDASEDRRRFRFFGKAKSNSS
jgi:signal transduction histidine kinase/ligand-binding sensor domain-containing protein